MEDEVKKIERDGKWERRNERWRENVRWDLGNAREREREQRGCDQNNLGEFEKRSESEEGKTKERKMEWGFENLGCMEREIGTKKEL